MHHLLLKKIRRRVFLGRTDAGIVNLTLIWYVVQNIFIVKEMFPNYCDFLDKVLESFLKENVEKAGSVK